MSSSHCTEKSVRIMRVREKSENNVRKCCRMSPQILLSCHLNFSLRVAGTKYGRTERGNIQDFNSCNKQTQNTINVPRNLWQVHFEYGGLCRFRGLLGTKYIPLGSVKGFLGPNSHFHFHLFSVQRRPSQVIKPEDRSWRKVNVVFW